MKMRAGRRTKVCTRLHPPLKHNAKTYVVHNTGMELGHVLQQVALGLCTRWWSSIPIPQSEIALCTICQHGVCTSRPHKAVAQRCHKVLQQVLASLRPHAIAKHYLFQTMCILSEVKFAIVAVLKKCAHWTVPMEVACPSVAWLAYYSDGAFRRQFQNSFRVWYV